jgi:hypothetical protein
MMLRVPACLLDQRDCEADVAIFYISVLRGHTAESLTQFVSGNCGDFVLGLVPETSG